MIDKIILNKISLSFGNKQIFSDTSLTFNAGKIVAVTGANGAGKSTLLKLAGQFIKPDTGTVTAFEGSKLIERTDFRQRLAVIAPSMNLYERLTALENFKFFAGLRNVCCNDDDIDTIFNKVQLDFSDKSKLVCDFSTGMKQKLKFAILLSVNADVWLLDEPCSNLDEHGKKLIFSEMKFAVSKGKLILMATNNIDETAMADEIVNLPIN